jgi:hypothetical protein
MSEWHLRPTVPESCHRWLPRHACVGADVAHEYAGECTSSFSFPNDLFAVLGGKMGVAGIGSALSTQFDFTKMTNSGLLNAAQKLGNEGKISSGDEIQLAGIASGVDSYPTNGIASSVSNTLQDPTQKDFIDILTCSFQL